MTSQASAAPSGEKSGRHQRSIRNYLLDSRFQLKYTGFIVGVALVISLVLGAFLWHTSTQVVAESKKVSDVVKMSITDDPFYGSNPELTKSFTDASDASDQKIVGQQHAMIGSVIGGLTLLVVLIGLLGIYFTHKVVGPIFKMKKLLKQVGEGKLNFQGGLRKGDELQDFFEAFAGMVASLKERQSKEIEILEAGIASAKDSGATEESLAKLYEVRDAMKRALDA